MANGDGGGGAGPIPATHAKALKGPHVRLVAGIGLIVLVTGLFLYIYAKRKNAPVTDTSAGSLGGTGQGTTAWDSLTYNVNYTPAAQGSTNNPAPTGGTTGSGTTSPGSSGGGSGTPTAGSGGSGHHPATGGSGGHKRPRRHTTHPVVHHSTPHTMHHPAVTGGRGTGAGAPKSADPGGTGAGQGGSEALTVHNSGGGGGGSVPVLSGIGDGVNWLFGGSHPRIPIF